MEKFLFESLFFVNFVVEPIIFACCVGSVYLMEMSVEKSEQSENITFCGSWSFMSSILS